jgi:hypothetical protein
MAARLKVFVTSDGLTDYVVAATSRAKALAAWGVRQDLFKEGRAAETADAALVAAALAKPGEVLTRSKGAKALAAFKAPPPAKRSDGPTAAQRRRIEKLEAELDELKSAFARRQNDLAKQIARLETERDDARRAFETQRRALQARLDQAGRPKPR